jgi:hypothetical protein
MNLSKVMVKTQEGIANSILDYSKVDSSFSDCSSGKTIADTDSDLSYPVGDDRDPLMNKEVDLFVPKPNVRMERILGKIESDGDVWVERFYFSKKGRKIFYYRSVLTNRCVLLEPPTGATIVFLDELDRFPYLRGFALDPLDRPLKDIEKPDFDAPSYRARKK